jgi:ribonuclease P/MRP protein subunit POP1
VLHPLLTRIISQLLIPGTRLEPTPTDDTIPILLSQRTLPAISLPSRRSEMYFGSTGPIQNSWDADHDEMSGWTLTIPSKWGMAFWNSLVFSETRVGGLRERSQQMFEAGRPRFPEDYPGTKAFVEYELRRAAEDQTYHDRRPPAKRPSYAKLGTVDPVLANFSGILDEIWRETEDWRLAAQTQTHRREHPSDPPAQPNVWLVSPRTATLVLTLSTSEKPGMFTSFDPRSELAARLLREYHGDTKLYALDGRVSTQLAVDLYGALVRVTVTPCGRGSPEELGLLYHLPDDVWESLVDKLLSEEKEKGTRRVSTTEEAYEQPSVSLPLVLEMICTDESFS